MRKSAPVRECRRGVGGVRGMSMGRRSSQPLCTTLAGRAVVVQENRAMQTERSRQNGVVLEKFPAQPRITPERPCRTVAAMGAEPRCRPGDMERNHGVRNHGVRNHGADPRGGTPGGSDARTPRARPQSRSRRTERHRRAYKPAPRRHRRRGNAKGQVISYLASLVGLPGLEPGTSSLSVKRSNHLSYSPVSNYVRNLIEITRSWRVSRIERGVR